MLDPKRVEAARSTARGAGPSKNTLTGISYAYEDVADYQAGAITLFNATGILEGIASAALVDSFVNAQSPAERHDAFSFYLSLRWLAFDLVKRGQAAGTRVYHSLSFPDTCGVLSPMFQAAGWIEKAKTLVEYIWTDYLNENPEQLRIKFGVPAPGPHDIITNFYLVHKPAWFTTMTTLSDPNIWRQHGYNPDADSMGPYWMLAQVWDDPDPAVVRNALQATRDLNIGTTFIKDNPPGKRVYIVDEFLLFYDHDIRSVNMRRKLMGLPMVPVESYITDMDLPLDVLPFAVDDVFYPAYEKMCGEIGIAPYQPENPVKVRLDRDAIRVLRV